MTARRRLAERYREARQRGLGQCAPHAAAGWPAHSPAGDLAALLNAAADHRSHGSRKVARKLIETARRWRTEGVAT